MYVGLSLLFSGSANKEDEEGEVEQYLQMSVRWAETPLQHLQAMTNLGMNTNLWNMYAWMKTSSNQF